MNIDEEDIEHILGPDEFYNGKFLFDQNCVLSIKNEEHGINGFSCSGEVKEPWSARSYSASVALFFDERNDLTFNGSCRCDSIYICEHITALALKFLDKNKRFAPGNTKEWIESFRGNIDNNSESSENSNRFLIYRLFRNGLNNEHGNLVVCEAKRLKNDQVSVGKPINHHNFTQQEQSSWWRKRFDPLLDDNDKDSEILGLYSAFDKHEGYGINPYIHGSLGYRLVEKLIHTNRAYFHKSRNELRFTSDYFVPVFWWSEINTPSGKAFKLVSNFAISFDNGVNPPAFLLVHTKPHLVIDTKNDQIMHLDPSVNEADLAKFIEAPLVPADQLKEIHQRLNELTELQIESPSYLNTHLVNHEIQPAINIVENELGERFVHYISKYGEHDVEFFPQRDVGYVYVGDLGVEITRNLKAEVDAKNKLKTFNLNDEPIGNQLIFRPNVHDNKQAQLRTWRLFLDSGVKELEELGWKVVFSEGFKLTFAPSTDVNIDCIRENDWFSLSFEFEFNGKKMSLVPLVSEIIKEIDSVENMPDELLVEVELGQYVPVKSEQVKPVINTLIQLFDQRGKDDTIKVGGFNAHLLDDLNDGVPWKGDNEILEIRDKLKNFSGIKKVPTPTSIKATLRDYQAVGLNWLNFLNEMSFNGILADDMGLGKTLQTICCLQHLKDAGRLNGPSLVIVPTSLVQNWLDELKKFAPKMNTLELYGHRRSKLFELIGDFDVVITTYSLVNRDIKKHQTIKYEYIILDEAQNIKNPKTKSARAICSLNSSHRLALSGTPIENHLGEMWSLFHFLMPGFLKRESDFTRDFRNPIEKENDAQRHQQLKNRIKPFILRRTKDEVASDLPEKNEIIKYITMDKKQAEFYESVRMTMDAKVNEAINEKGLNKSQIHIFDALLKLRQVCCHPALVKIDNAQLVEESVKLNAYLNMIEGLIAEGRKVLVFSSFKSMLDVMSDELDKLQIKYAMLTGQSQNRGQIISSFTSGQVPVFLISLKAGGVGLNLTQADTVIHYDPWWNPAAEKQATDRAHRIGQENKVFVYKLIVKSTIEENILKLQKKKEHLQESIYDGGVSTSDKGLSNKDLLGLLKGK